MRSNKKGFTLIELTVVLLVLVALAGIMVPLLTGYVERSNAAGSASNISELVKQIELYKVKTLKGYPDRLDSLLNTDGTVWTRLPWDNATLPVLTATPLNASTLASLNAAGITTLKDSGSITAGQPATFTVPPSASDITLAVGSNVAEITNAMSLTMCVPNADTVNNHYFLFGLGNGCAAVGTVMSAAPVNFDTSDPQLVYQHFGVILRVPKTGTASAGSAATLVNAATMRANGIHALPCSLKAYAKSTMVQP